MKKFIVMLVCFLFVSVAVADDGLKSVLKNKPAEAVVAPQVEQETGWVVVPLLGARRVYRAVQVPKVEVVPVVPVVPAVPLVVPPPVKPQFKTPLRDGAYYGLYYSRAYRWNRLGNKLNVQPCQGPGCQRVQQQQ